MRVSIFDHTLTAAKATTMDNLQEQVQKDLDKITQFLMDNTNASIFANIKKPGKNPLAQTKKAQKHRSNWQVLRDFDNEKLLHLPTIEKLEHHLNGDKKVLDPNKYTFGYLIAMHGFIERDYDTKKCSFIELTEESKAKGLKPYLSILNANKSGTAPVIQGKVIDLLLLNDASEGLMPHLFAYIAVKVDVSKFKKVLAAFGATKASSTILLANIYHGLINGKSIPSFYTKEITYTKAVKSQAYIMPSGSIVYIPDLNKSDAVSRNIEAMKAALAGTSEGGRMPNNSVYFADDETSTLICTNQVGFLDSYSLLGMAPPDTRFQLHILNKPLSSLMSQTEGNLASYVNVRYSNAASNRHEELVTKYGHDTPLSEVVEDSEFAILLDDCIKYGMERYGAVKISNWMSYMGMLYILKKLRSTAKKLVKEVKEKEAKFLKATPDTAPALPNMRKDAIQFPHQAEALAKLDIAVDSAIIDIATGGGKAGIIIQDCINLLNKGLINRPMVVMPNALIGQFLSEISFFTDNQVNGFALTSSIENNRGLDELTRLAKSAPKNTIFLTTFSWLSKGGAQPDFDIEGNLIKSFASTSWLQEELGIDYLAVDESQNIKNMKSNAYLAVSALGRTIKYKRISTGTLISNKPTDLVGQLRFLDPLLIGTQKDFEQKYAIDGNSSNGYKATMAEEIRARLRSGSSYIMYREKDWATLLPKKVYSFTRVSQTPEQAKIYKDMVAGVMQEIMSDPKLKAAWLKMKEEGQEMEGIPAALLGKFAKLEKFLTAPDSSTLMQYADASRISPKVAAIDKLIDDSFKMKGPNNKVIVGVHYKSAARHLLQHSKHNAVGAYYDASQKDLIPKFQSPDSNIKVLFAVVQSIKEGLNLQIANRIIIADVDWTPGNLKQLEARVFRPHVKINGEDVTNLNKGKTVYIDTVIADDSADCVKYAFQNYKKILNSIIMEECTVDTPKRVELTEDALAAKFTDPIINGNDVLDKVDQFNAWNQEVIDTFAKKGELKFRVVKKTKSNIGTDAHETPWVKGMALPAADDEEPLLKYLETLGLDTDSEDDDIDEDDSENENIGLDLSDYADQLMGIRVRCEYGEGRIYSVRKKSIVIRLNKGENVTLKPVVVLHKIGSVAKGLSKKDLRKGVDKKGEKKLAQKPDRQALGQKDRTPRGSGDSSRNPGHIKDGLAAMGVKAKKQKSKSTGEVRIVLLHGDDELIVPTEHFKTYTLGEWKEFAEQLLNGETGSGGKKKDKKPALSEDKVSKKDKALSKDKKKDKGKDKSKALDMDDDEDDIDLNADDDDQDNDLDLDIDFDSDEDEAPKKPKKPGADPKKAADDLDSYLDEDFDFTRPEPKKRVVDKNKGTTEDLDELDDTVNAMKKRIVKKAGDRYKEAGKIFEKPKAGKDKPTTKEEAEFRFNVSSYNNIPSITVHCAEGNEGLENLGFEWSGVYWEFPVTNPKLAKTILSDLEDKYNIPYESMHNLKQCLAEFKSGIFKTAIPEDGVKDFILKNSKNAKKGQLRLYPLVVGDKLYFVVDAAKHPGIALSAHKFHKKDGYYIYIAPTVAALRKKFGATTKRFKLDPTQPEKLAKAHLKLQVG